MSTSLNSSVSHNLSTPVKTQWATSTRTQTTSQYISKTYCTHIHVHTWSNAQHYIMANKMFMCKYYEQIWNFFIDSNGALMNVVEECQFISWACNDTVEYDSVLCTSLVSQIWLRRVCLKAQRQLIGLTDWLNKLRGLVRISGYISHKQMGIQIKADQI